MSETVRPGGTYKTLDEQREVLSPAEEKFERARQTIGLFLGPIAFLIMYFASLPLEATHRNWPRSSRLPSCTGSHSGLLEY
jgi:hypothetical protein